MRVTRGRGGSVSKRRTVDDISWSCTGNKCKRVQYCIYCLNDVRNLEHKFSDFNEIVVDEFASACYVCLSKSELFNRVNRCKPRAYSKKTNIV